MMAGDDQALAMASQRARDTFKYFWRELSWEFRRIVPALDLACVKIAFTDGDAHREGPSHEHMWVSNVNYDGKHITGSLMNSPRWLSNIKEGDAVTTTLSELGDWMFSIHGRVYGAFTVNLIRSRMSLADRKAHDVAWGLDFGDPDSIELVYQRPKEKKNFLSSIFGKKPESVDRSEISTLVEHPMSINMGDKLREQLKDFPELIHRRDERGWTFLHGESLAGNLTSVRILIEHGADPLLKTSDGATALDLAETLHWDHVANYLQMTKNKQ